MIASLLITLLARARQGYQGNVDADLVCVDKMEKHKDSLFPVGGGCHIYITLNSKKTSPCDYRCEEPQQGREGYVTSGSVVSDHTITMVSRVEPRPESLSKKVWFK